MSNWIKFTNNNLEAFGIISGSEVECLRWRYV